MWKNLLRPTAGRETRQPDAEQRAAPPAAARRGAATSRSRPARAPPSTSDSKRARVSKLFPCALRADDPPAGPLSSRRRSDESQTSFRRCAEQPSRELLGLRAPPPGPRGRPAHSTTGIVCPRRFPPPPPHTQRVSCLGAGARLPTGELQRAPGSPAAARQTPLRRRKRGPRRGGRRPASPWW